MADLQAAEAELARLGEARPTPTLPPLQQVIERAGGWGEIVKAGDIPARRTLLAALVERIVPRRTGWRKYEAEITWTPIGEALAKLAEHLATEAA
jgi:hypothetical protein